MDITQHDILIIGVTQNGALFRPSDWAERLSSVLYSMDRDNQAGYSSHVRTVRLEGVKCVVVSKELALLAPQAYDFLMGFAQENGLKVENGEDWVKTHPEAVVGTS